VREADLVLWDLDGCLIDSTRAITGCIVHALRSLGVDPLPDPDTLTWCIGPPLLDSLERLLVDAGHDPADATRGLDLYRERYVTASLVETEVTPGIVSVLEAVGRGSAMAVVTSKPAQAAEPLLDHLGLRDAFVAVHAPDADHRVEPKEVTLARALAHLVPTGRVDAVMVGDRSHDVIAGRACGTATVGVTWGAGDRRELVDAGADAVVDTPAQLRALLT
jgi:phosphoglycolate phosphatase